MRRNVLKLCAALFSLSSCMVGPNYHTPNTAMPEGFTEKKMTAQAGEAVDLCSWWKQFGDEGLNFLVQEAVKENFDLQIALEKIKEARAFYDIQWAKLWPEINLDASAGRQRISDNLSDSQFLGPSVQSFFQVGFDASWELDIFGKQRRAKEAAFYEIQSAQESMRSVYVTLISEVVRVYVDLIATNKKILVLREHIASRKELLKLAIERFEAGLASEIEVRQLEGELKSLEASLPPFETSLQHSLHLLAVLLAKTPESMASWNDFSKPILKAQGKIPLGMPSDLLRRRPDIAKAERDLAAATAQIGVAVADLFPRFTLTGGYGFESSRLKKLFHGSSRAWNIGPSFGGSVMPTMSWPIWTFGRIQANIRVQTSIQKQMFLTYEKTVLNALKDVENALVSYCKEEDRNESFEDKVNAFRREKDLSQSLYKAGLRSLDAVLNAQNLLFEAENELIASDQILATDLIAVYKSLGGDWPCSSSP